MRSIAIEESGKYQRFHSINGTAAETRLDEKSVDHITLAQAFHWFDISDGINQVSFEIYSKNKFISRSLSGSYSLRKEDENYSKYIDSLTKVFERHSKNNTITIANKTAAYIGTLN